MSNVFGLIVSGRLVRESTDIKLRSFVTIAESCDRRSMFCAGADGLHAALGDAVPGDDRGGRRHQPRRGVPHGPGAAAGRHGGHGVLELAGPGRAA